MLDADFEPQALKGQSLDLIFFLSRSSLLLGGNGIINDFRKILLSSLLQPGISGFEKRCVCAGIRETSSRPRVSFKIREEESDAGNTHAPRFIKSDASTVLVVAFSALCSKSTGTGLRFLRRPFTVGEGKRPIAIQISLN